MNVAAFLARHTPFDSLEPEEVARVAEAVRVEFFPAGSVILEQSGSPSSHLYVVRTGAVELLDEGRLIDLLNEGEMFGYLSLVSQGPPTATVRAHEDTICYLIDRDAAEAVLGTRSGIAQMVSALTERLARSRPLSDPTALRRAPVGSLVRRPPITCSPETSIAEAARLMAEHRISCLLVSHGGALGILTDRDLRSRVLAAGRTPDVPVSAVMTFPARTMPAAAMVGEVLSAMLDGGFHHFPIVDGKGTLVGVVTDTDLMGLERQSPFALRSAIERSPDRDSAVDAALGLRETVCVMVEGSVDPVDVGHVIAVTIDTLARRLIDLAVEQAGTPPAPWTWLALGSEARQEQALNTDQDHALAYDWTGAAEEIDPYFEGVATAVTSGLEAAGIRRCNGDAMAVNRPLRRSLGDWIAAFKGWMGDPGVEGSILSSIVFDYRGLAGPLDVEPVFDEVVASAPERYPQFLRHLARRALDLRPPTGFLRDLVVEGKGEHAGSLDVKHGGIMIITNLARAYAVRAARSEKRTLDRLSGAVASGQIDEETRMALEEAFRLLWRTRLEHQVAQIRDGREPDDFVDPKTLGPIRRQGLKEAFRIIGREQRTLAADLGVR